MLISSSWFSSKAAVEANEEGWAWLREFLRDAEAESLYRKVSIWCHDSGIGSLDALLLQQSDFCAQPFYTQLLSVTRERIDGALLAAERGDIVSASDSARAPRDHLAPASSAQRAEDGPADEEASGRRVGGYRWQNPQAAAPSWDDESPQSSAAPVHAGEDGIARGDRCAAAPSSAAPDAARESRAVSLDSVPASSRLHDWIATQGEGADDLVVSFANEQSGHLDGADGASMSSEGPSCPSLYAQTINSSEGTGSAGQEGGRRIVRANSEFGVAVSPRFAPPPVAKSTSSTRRLPEGAAPPAAHPTVLDTVDTTGDGVPDSVVLDVSGDALPDAVRKIEWRMGPKERVAMLKSDREARKVASHQLLRSGSAAIDTTGDGQADTIAVDTTGDGHVDTLRRMGAHGGAGASDAAMRGPELKHAGRPPSTSSEIQAYTARV